MLDDDRRAISTDRIPPNRAGRKQVTVSSDLALHGQHRAIMNAQLQHPRSLQSIVQVGPS